MATKKPHAVCVPFPAQSHVKAMLKLAKLLHFRGFHITFVNTDFIHERMIQSSDADSLLGSPSFRFETISDGFPISYERDIVHLSESTTRRFLSPFQDLIMKLSSESTTMDGPPPVSCIVTDAVMSFSGEAAEGFGLPLAVLFTIPACAIMAIKQIPALVERGILPFKDEKQLEDEYLNQKIPWIIPGMSGDIRLRDIPRISRETDPNGMMLSIGINAVTLASKATVIIVHTFNSLEHEVLDALNSMGKLVIPIGPLQLLLNQIPTNNPIGSIDGNIWKEDIECLKWLDLRPPNSVIYVNFGSLVHLSVDQLIEFAMGLASSECPFLWVIRPDLVIGGSAILPPEFALDTKERGFITSWCPQEEVLNHSSIGGFLTHSGWNSTIESISCGVPMLCWPFAGDQYIICRYCCVEWGIGMEVNYNVTRNEVEKLVKGLMEGENGVKMRKKGNGVEKVSSRSGDKGRLFLKKLRRIGESTFIKICYQVISP